MKVVALSPDEQAARAVRIKAFWDAELSPIVEEMKASYTSEWQSTEPHESNLRDECYRMVSAADLFEQHIISVIADGDYSNLKLRRDERNGRSRSS